MAQPTATWVLVADANAARIFKFDDAAQPWTLLEKISSDTAEAGTRDFGKKASNHKGALHNHGDMVGVEKGTAERRFAHLLAHVLERGLAEGAFARLVLAAPPKLLGELRENLSRGLHEKVVAELHKEYSHLPTAELSKHVLTAMGEAREQAGRA